MNKRKAEQYGWNMAKELLVQAKNSVYSDNQITTQLVQEQNQLLADLNQNLQRQNSWKWSLLLGALRGVGVAVGATLVAAVLFAILSQVVNTVDDVPLLEQLIEDIELKEALNNSSFVRS